jgi:hypothetical protein
MIFITVTGILCPISQFSLLMSEHSLSLLILGLSINVFWIIQLPLVTKANVVVDFSVDNVENFRDEIDLKATTEQTIYFRIYNSGYSTLKNSVILIYFGQGIEIIPYKNLQYEQLDFKKSFSIQKCHRGVLFTPLKNFQTIPPQEWFVFPVIVKSSYRIVSLVSFLLNSENSWGQTRYVRKMNIR